MAAAAVEPKSAPQPEEKPAMPVEGEDSLDPAEEADRSLLLSALAGAGELQATLQFPEIASLVAAAEVTSERGLAWKQELEHAYGKAAEFSTLLSTELTEKGYAGMIRRREGVPLDAEITSANPSFLVVDLGFGPNEVTLEQFAPDWMVEAAGELLGEPGASRIEDWERVIFFALATQQTGEAERLAEIISGANETFKARWEKISKLRSG